MPKRNILKRTVNKAEDKIQDSWESAKDKFESVENSSVNYIKKNPIKSVLIALGIGAIIGAGAYIGIQSAIKARMRRQSVWQKYNPFN